MKKTGDLLGGGGGWSFWGLAGGRWSVGGCLNQASVVAAAAAGATTAVAVSCGGI